MQAETVVCKHGITCKLVASTHARAHTHTHTQTHTCTVCEACTHYACAHIYTHTHTNIDTHVFTVCDAHTHTHTHSCTLTLCDTHTHIFAQCMTRVHTHTYLHIYTACDVNAIQHARAANTSSKHTWAHTQTHTRAHAHCRRKHTRTRTHTYTERCIHTSCKIACTIRLQSDWAQKWVPDTQKCAFKLWKQASFFSLFKACACMLSVVRSALSVAHSTLLRVQNTLSIILCKCSASPECAVRVGSKSVLCLLKARAFWDSVAHPPPFLDKM